MGKKGKSKKKVNDAVASAAPVPSEELLGGDSSGALYVPDPLDDGDEGTADAHLQRVSDGGGHERKPDQHEPLQGRDKDGSPAGGGTGDRDHLISWLPWWVLFVALGLGILVGAVIVQLFPMVD